MDIYTFPSGPFQTNALVIACAETQKAAIVDPGVDSAEAIFKCIDEHHLIPEKILLTHTHWDHTGNAAKVKEKFNIPVYVHAQDAPNLEKPGSDGLPLMVTIEGVKPDEYFDEEQEIHIGNLTFTVIYTPGHTPGGVCLYCQKENVLISGDTLFKGTIGNL